MERIKNFLKNKSVGYYIVALVALLALITAIVFFATYKTAMPSASSGVAPETIGIFLLVGCVVELVVLVVPQYRFIHIVAILMFGLSIYKELLYIPNLIADYINDVAFQGGNLPTNVFYLVMQLVIVLAAIVAAFIGFFKKDQEQSMAVSGMGSIITVSACAVVLVAVVLSGSLSSNALEKQAMKGQGMDVSSSSEESGEKENKPKYPLINDEIRAAADAVEYEFDPNTIIIQEQEEYDYSASDFTSLGYGSTRTGHNLVYVFEGEYSEGYQGQYNTYLTYIYLWDDGLYGGTANNTNIKGYWYNADNYAETDAETGDLIPNCLCLVSNQAHYESIIADPATGFYEWQAYVYLDLSWDTRSVVVSAYKYYPNVAAVIDTNGNENMKVGEKFPIDKKWFFDRVIKNLTYTPVPSGVTWNIPSGMLDANNRLAAAGEYEITGTWSGFTASATLKVS